MATRNRLTLAAARSTAYWSASFAFQFTWPKSRAMRSLE
jgi:hypothetical protein